MIYVLVAVIAFIGGVWAAKYVLTELHKLHERITVVKSMLEARLSEIEHKLP
jgi:hypothetical protein